MLAPRVTSMLSLRLSANTDFEEGLALHNSKVNEGKVLFFTLDKVSRGGDTTRRFRAETAEEECTEFAQVKAG